MHAVSSFLDSRLPLWLAALILIAFFFALDVGVVGADAWRDRFRRLGAWVLDRALGVEECSAGEKQIPFFAWVPMPEGPYLAKITFRPYTYRRRRWFASRVMRAHVLMEHPIPIPPPVPSDTKKNKRRLNEDQAVYFVMVPHASDLTAASLYVREYALNLRAKYVFTNGADFDQPRAVPT
jgi:hypothetical protein